MTMNGMPGAFDPKLLNIEVRQATNHGGAWNPALKDEKAPFEKCLTTKISNPFVEKLRADKMI
jgi:hypothetical protein